MKADRPQDRRRTRRRHALARQLALGASLALPSMVYAQTQVNISGATLVRPTMDRPYMTNDYIDVDGDGRYGYDPLSSWEVDQLAPEISSFTIPGGATGLGNLTPNYNLALPSSNNAEWLFQYRGVGSVNGLTDFVNYQLQSTIPSSIPGERGFINRLTWANGGNPSNAGGLLTGAHDPYRAPSQTPVQWQAVDIAVLDVPTAWAVVNPGAAAPRWDRKTNEAGYGLNPNLSNTGWSNQLASLQRGGQTLNTNTASPDANTVYDQSIAFVPVVPLLNPGVGVDGNNDGTADGNLRYTDLQHLSTTGRMSSGENLVGATRSAGSGTHNAWMNSLGVDPSWGRGDGVGSEFIQEQYGFLGTGAVGSGASYVAGGVGYQAAYAEASSGVEAATRNHRLAIGYTGIAGRAAHWSEGRYEIGNVMKNIDSDGDGVLDSSTFVRPTLQNIIAPTGEGYEIGGNAVWVSRGNPFAEDVDYDGNGILGQRTVDVGGDGIKGTADDTLEAAPWEVGQGGPAMSNSAARDFLRNVKASSDQFTAGPANLDVLGTPGQGLGTLFFLPAGMDSVQDGTDGTLFTDNPGVNLNLQSYLLANINIGLGAGVNIGAYGTSSRPYGDVPRRKGTAAGVAYSDGATTIVSATNSSSYLSGNVYRDVDGGSLVYGSALNQRNGIAGDFGGAAGWTAVMGYGDGKRDLNDVPMMMRAIGWRLGVAGYVKPDDHDGNGTAGTGLAIEIVGDFDGDGNFTAEDVRYFADGLAMTPGTSGDYTSRRLDRKAGFTAVDQHWTSGSASRPAGNFFGTTLATGKTYAAGDSRGDVAGATATLTPGANPLGHDGTVDADDIDYVYDQFKTNAFVTDGAANWSNLDEAVGFDLSADMTGDLIVDQADVDDLVRVVLGTEYGDANLDGEVGILDLDILGTNFGGSGGWAEGDFTGQPRQHPRPRRAGHVLRLRCRFQPGPDVRRGGFPDVRHDLRRTRRERSGAGGREPARRREPFASAAAANRLTTLLGTVRRRDVPGAFCTRSCAI